MATSLRERLAGLTATRSSGKIPALPQRAAAQSSAPGYSISDALHPFSARRWLDHLPAADPQAAALMVSDAPAVVPPLDQWLFLDLETTGLSGGTGTYAFLVGVGRVETQGFRMRQFFLRELAEERALLEALAPLLAEAAVVVTYNGKSFDAPVLETRYRLARRGGLPFELDGKPHLDLLYPARRLWRLRWDSLRLLDLEQNLLCYTRPEDIPGEFIPQVYFDYLRRGDDSALQVVFRHNAEDVVTLAALAARMLQLVAQPETAGGDGLELFALGRLFERARCLEQARDLYQQALAASLPTALEPAARYRLSLLCKRQRDYAEAVSLWQQLANANGSIRLRDKLAVYEELAICYEHRLDDREAALEVVQRALEEVESHLGAPGEDRRRCIRVREQLRHRLRRLEDKRLRALPLHCTSLRE